MNFVAASAVESSTFWKDLALEAISAGPRLRTVDLRKIGVARDAGLLHWWEAPDDVDQERREVDFLTGNAEVLALALRINSYQLTTLSFAIAIASNCALSISVLFNMNGLIYL